MRKRSHGFDWDEFPVIGGQGSLHDLAPPEEPPSRLLGFKSVSENAAYALRRQPAQPVRGPLGFYTGRPR